MKVLWKESPVAVDGIQAALEADGYPLAPPSIRTMLTILGKKGVVSRAQAGRRFLYSPAMDRETANRHFLKDMVERVFEGSGADLVAALVDARMVKGDDVERVRKLLDEFDDNDNPGGPS